MSAVPPGLPSWNVAVFAARESEQTLDDCVRALVAASPGRRLRIDLLVNGNRPLAQAAARRVGAHGGDARVSIRVWSLALGDKAHAWNEYLHRIAGGAPLTFFVDGYVRVKPDALALIASDLERHPQALGASAVPTAGRSAAALRANMIVHGGVCGGLYALSAAAVEMIQRAPFRLPLGLYRTDGIMGAALMYRMDPASQQWDRSAMRVHPDASWDQEGVGSWSWKHVAGQLQRLLRQAQGSLENAAAREHLSIRRLPPQALPATTAALVDGWVGAHRRQALRLFLKQPLALVALRKLRRRSDWGQAALAPEAMALAEPGAQQRA